MLLYKINGTSTKAERHGLSYYDKDPPLTMSVTPYLYGNWVPEISCVSLV